MLLDDIVLDKERIVVVIIRTADFFDQENYFMKLLSFVERERMARIPLADVRRNFVIHRGLLRMLLSKILKLDNEKILLNVSPFGKPALLSSSAIKFNLSHSQSYAMYGFSHREIGVDIKKPVVIFTSVKLRRWLCAKMN